MNCLFKLHSEFGGNEKQDVFSNLFPYLAALGSESAAY